MDLNTEDILIRFGRRLRDLRKEAGFSQEGFALHCELDRTYVGGVERGKRNVSLRNLDRFAGKLDMTLSRLLEGI